MSNELITQRPSPTTLIEMAIQKGVDIAQLKELMDLQDRWEAKQAKKSFLDALSKFQTIVPQLKKTKTASIASQKGSFSYKYADLGTIAQSIKEALNQCGLSYRWEFEEANNKMKVTCQVSHRDGHTEITSMEAGLDGTGFKNDIQQKGSTHTYLQRYTLIGALGLSTADQDTDAKGQQKTQEFSAKEIKEQWKQVIDAVKSKIELQGLYLKNKKVVDADASLQEMFKAKQDDLKGSVNPKTVLP